MKFCIIALSLIGLVAADVSHLLVGQGAGYNYGVSSASASSSSSSYSALPGGDSSSYQPEHLIPQNLRTASAEATSAQVIPGSDSSSYQPANLIPQNLRTASAAVASESYNIGADIETPEQFIPESARVAHNNYVQSQAQAVVPGGDSSSYQPEHLIPQNLRTASAEATSAQVIPGSDSSSYQPAHLIPQHLKSASAAVATESYNIGADTQTPEQFIPEEVRVAHNNYVQSQAQAVVPGGDSSSYQPEHLIPQNLRAPSAAVASESYNIGADTQTPEQFIPEEVRVAHNSYVQSQAQAVIPGSDSSSYQPANLIPQNLRTASAAVASESYNIGADTQTPEQFIPEADRVAHARYQEPTTNGIEEFNPETHVPIAIGRDTITPAHLQRQYSAGASASASASASAGGSTQYGSNGGYVY